MDNVNEYIKLMTGNQRNVSEHPFHCLIHIELDILRCCECHHKLHIDFVSVAGSIGLSKRFVMYFNL